jgi:hypothetical protein
MERSSNRKWRCSCHVLQWQFSCHGSPVVLPWRKEDEDVIQVWDSQAKKNQSRQVLQPFVAHKTLGHHYKDPAGTQCEQFRQLKSKSDEITAFIWKFPMTRLEAWTYYYACYLPSVGYPLPFSTLAQNQLDDIQKKAMSIIVPRCGFNRNTRKEILYGPLELGGASFRHLYVVRQGIGQVQLFVWHWRSASKAGCLLRIAVSWFQFQVGVSYSFLEQVHTQLPHCLGVKMASISPRVFIVD